MRPRPRSARRQSLDQRRGLREQPREGRASPAPHELLDLREQIREQIRESLGFNDPFLVRWVNWLRLMVVNEPIHAFEQVTNTCIGDCESRDRIISWSSRSKAICWPRVSTPHRRRRGPGCSSGRVRYRNGWRSRVGGHP